jgi:hypothetical protein
VIAAVGVHGAIALIVTQRTRELGIRLALGARSGELVRLVVGRSVASTCVGMAVGLAIAAASTRYLQSMLFGVTTLDLTTFVGGAGPFGMWQCSLPIFRRGEQRTWTLSSHCASNRLRSDRNRTPLGQGPFCSHLAMRGPPACDSGGSQDHPDLSTPQRNMHVSPTAFNDASRLLKAPRSSHESPP